MTAAHRPSLRFWIEPSPRPRLTGIYTYDPQGNRTQTAVSGGPTTTYGYNQANQLCWSLVGTSTNSCGSAPAGATTYTYDADNLRTSKTTGASTTTFAWDQTATPLVLQEQTSGSTTSYIYGPNGAPVEQLNGTTPTYLLQDQLGSTRYLTDASGAVVGSYTYSAYGAVAIHTGANSNLQYAGQYTDAETGFIYLRNRYYDPATAQFLNQDPAIAQTESAYGYADDDPIDVTDQDGLGPAPRTLSGNLPGPPCIDLHCIINDAKGASAVVQLGADGVAIVTAPVPGLDGATPVALAIAGGAGGINVVATCAQYAAEGGSRSECLTDLAVTLGTEGVGGGVEKGVSRGYLSESAGGEFRGGMGFLSDIFGFAGGSGGSSGSAFGQQFYAYVCGSDRRNF